MSEPGLSVPSFVSGIGLCAGRSKSYTARSTPFFSGVGGPPWGDGVPCWVLTSTLSVLDLAHRSPKRWRASSVVVGGVPVGVDCLFTMEYLEAGI